MNKDSVLTFALVLLFIIFGELAVIIGTFMAFIYLLIPNGVFPFGIFYWGIRFFGVELTLTWWFIVGSLGTAILYMAGEPGAMVD
jgi:hypothetical protein